jgi:alpha-N-acetylglucosaminidase
MTPVLQGFTGHVPEALKRVRPEAGFQKLTPWGGFPSTSFVDPLDPAFNEIGKRFLDQQKRDFGTDHFYASDTFIEMEPSRSDPEFLAAMGKAVYGAMKVADPEAIWVMQGWMFVNRPKFWQEPQGRALLGAVPDDRLILLDLACERYAAWVKTRSFYGKPWVWNVVQDFGDLVSLHAGMPTIAAGLAKALTSPDRGSLVGVGMVNEGLGYNPVVNDFIGEMAWRNETPDLGEWIRGHVQARYGSTPAPARAAWDLLLQTAYRNPVNRLSPVTRRPSLPKGGWVRGAREEPPYDFRLLARAWRELLNCAGDLGGNDNYRYDLVQVARQTLADLAYEWHGDIAAAYEKKDRKALAPACERYLQLIRDMDTLVATRRELLLGKWLSDAKRWATNDEEKRLYEFNARTIITMWGPPGDRHYEYANKHWSGLLNDFYLARWKMYFERLDRALAEGTELDSKAWEQFVIDWEAQWGRRTNVYPAEPRGDSVVAARQLWDRYAEYLVGTGKQMASRRADLP